MIDFEKEGLYVALRCIDRIENHLGNERKNLPDEIREFVNDLWAVLRGAKKRVALEKIDRKIDRLIMDEQDADFGQSLVNRYFYALSNIIIYLRDGDGSSVDATLEEGLEFFRYIAANEFVRSLGGDAMILSASDEEKIESDSNVVFEKNMQAEDKNYAATISDWSSVDRIYLK